MKRGHKRRGLVFLLAASALLLLTLPAPYPTARVAARARPFSWNRDGLWRELEARFVGASRRGRDESASLAREGLRSLRARIRRLDATPRGASDPLWLEVERSMLALAPLVAANPSSASDFAASVHELRRVVKQQAVHWPAGSPLTRERLYRLIYGGRTALEAILLQAPRGANLPPSISRYAEAPASPVPSLVVRGVRIQSGDILVSRGGAPTSALIARGSDFPGNFSHVALAHVDEQRRGAVIESLIEKGVVVSSVADYLRDKKLRIMVLRLRADHPALRRDPTLPHRAASWMLRRARASHIPYDFAMRFDDHHRMFCSEVVYAAYEQAGVTLWTGLSRVSAAGTARWLVGFGVENLVTLEPSDIEYDPQLVTVAEWLDRAQLAKDRIDNAATDVLLEGANAGDALRYDVALLPLARLLKAFSVLKEQWGGRGPIPEGMSPAAALRNRWYSARHAELAERLAAAAESFRQEKGYSAPYWRLVELARVAHGQR